MDRVKVKTIYIEGAFGTIGAMAFEALSAKSGVVLGDSKEDGFSFEIKLLPKVPKGDQYLSDRIECIQKADLVMVCAEGEALDTVLEHVRGHTKVLDVSATKRFAEGWVYGLPELGGRLEVIKKASRVAHPGCFASSAILVLEPLIRAGLLDAASPIALSSVGGYSTGGKKMVQRALEGALTSDTAYGLLEAHPHTGEIQKACGLLHRPAFYPVVGLFERGILTQFSIPKSDTVSMETVKAAYQAAFKEFEPNRGVPPGQKSAGEGAQWSVTEARLSAEKTIGTALAFVQASETDDMITLFCTLDNLGKGGAISAAQMACWMLEETEDE